MRDGGERGLPASGVDADAIATGDGVPSPPATTVQFDHALGREEPIGEPDDLLRWQHDELVIDRPPADRLDDLAACKGRRLRDDRAVEPRPE